MDVLERGDIVFVFRPTVQKADALTTTLGVQSFFMLLAPAGGLQRRVRIGKNRLPTKSGERFWARVERVGSMEHVLGYLMEDEQYSTKTKGERYQPAARVIGQGSYELARHEDHVHFVYRLDHLEHDAPEELHVADVGDYLVLFERRENSRSRAAWTVEGDPARLDTEGEELVIVGHGECTDSGDRRNYGKSEMVE